jgi:ubiquinone biosynthesis protein
MKSAVRALAIVQTALRFGLDEWLPPSRFSFLLRGLKALTPGVAEHKDLARGVRLRLALQSLGPLFVKLGQVLSTRRDLLPADVADELAGLRDQVQAFDSAQAKALVAQAIGKPLGEVFAYFEEAPLASASIAQVHAAGLPDGRAVVVKVRRPGIEARIRDDIALMRQMARLLQRLHPHADKIRPQDVVSELESTLLAECDFQREAANASLMRRLWQDSADLSVPAIEWPLTSEGVLVMQRVHGIPADDIAELDRLGFDRKALAAKAVRLLYQQVFRDNYFHADAHAGNIWVDHSAPQQARFIAIDFGIVGQLSELDQYYLAENFMAIFQKDYRKIARLHVQAGWMPKHLRLDELEAAVRGVCEPYFTRPLSEFSIAEVIGKLLRTAQKYELTLQPQLILLQKTLLNTEGLARTLDPDIDLWAVAQPVLEGILRERYNPKRFFEKLRAHWPEATHEAAALPRLVQRFLSQQVDGESQVRMRSDEIAQLVRISQRNQRQLFALAVATGAGLAAVLMKLFLQPMPWVYALAGISLLAFAWAWPRKP